MTYKTTGTLKEIGAKVGDVVSTGWGEFKVTDFYLEQCVHNGYTIISRANPTGPVRTVTKKEIVPGVYGAVSVSEIRNHSNERVVCIGIGSWLTQDGLTAAIATLTEIRDAL